MAFAMLVESEEPMQREGHPFTRADLERMPDDGRRYEIIDGVLLVSAAPGRLHQRAVKRATFLLDAACPPELEVLLAPFAVALADDTEMQPDVLVGWRKDFTDRDLPKPPILVVEVLSGGLKWWLQRQVAVPFSHPEWPSSGFGGVGC